MSDGQTETNEMIAAQNAPRCVRLERGEAVCWHDGEQWQTGCKLYQIGEVVGRMNMVTKKWMTLVQSRDVVYYVEVDALKHYGTRCDRCDGSGVDVGLEAEVSADLKHAKPVYVAQQCPACGGSGRRRA